MSPTEQFISDLNRIRMEDDMPSTRWHSNSLREMASYRAPICLRCAERKTRMDGIRLWLTFACFAIAATAVFFIALNL